jgi:ribosomal protein S9
MIGSRVPNAFQPSSQSLPMAIYIGFVKQNTDAQCMGRLGVYIPELGGGDPTDPGSWITVSYVSPFAGSTDPTKLSKSSITMDGSQQSYGFWAVPPDLNNEVVVFFANNDMSRGYWLGCTYQQNMNWMVPGIAVNVTTEPGTPLKIAPVVEYNKASVGDTTNPRRPRFEPLANGLAIEGLTSDTERGSASTSARRESPSQVFGFLSPRGNTMHVDDNTANEFIRLRSRSGAQVLIHETSGYIYINSKNGNSWIEVSDTGVDIYTADSISMRAEKDLNIRADRDILLDAGGNIHMRAGANITAAARADVQLQANAKINLNANNNIELTSAGNILNIAASDFQVTSAVDLIMQAGGAGSVNVAADLNVLAGGNLRLQSGLQMSQRAGSQQMRDGTSVLDMTGAAPPAMPDSPVTITPPVLPVGLMHGDAKQSFVNDTIPLWKAGAQINTIVSRMPTHEPWHDHPNGDIPPPPTSCTEINATGTFGAGSSSNVNADGTLNDTGCSPGAAGTKPISTEVFNAIMQACTKTNADPATMLAFADMESSFQPGIGAKTSSATGLYQFTQGTWGAMVTKYGNQYNVGFSQINEAQSNALMGGQFINDNAALLKKQGINNPTPGQLYIMHFAGSSGGPKLIAAAQNTPNDSAASLFPAAAAANPSIFRNRSCAEVVASLSAIADAKAKAYSGQYGLPAPCDRNTTGNPATPLDPTASAAAAMAAPQPVNLATQPASSATLGGGRPAVVPPPVINAPVGGSGECDQTPGGLAALKPNANGFVGPTSSPASLLSNLSNPTQWKKGNADYTTWAANQPIAIFNDNGTYRDHAAIYLGIVQIGNPNYTGIAGIQVYSQAPGQPAGERIIPFDIASPDNARLYAAVNLGSNPQASNRVQAACIQAYPAHTGNCSGFVQAVGSLLGVTITGNANAITAALKAGGQWSPLSNGVAAAASAQAGQLVVAGLNGSQQAQPDIHGHVVVVVAGPLVRGQFPTAYWGSLGSRAGAFESVNYAWTAQDLPNVTYAAMTI